MARRRLEPLLLLVSMPSWYVGGELNPVAKNYGAADVGWALMCWDAHGACIPNQGIQILCKVPTEHDGGLAERTCNGWPGLAEVMDSAGTEFTVGPHRLMRACGVPGAMPAGRAVR